MSKKIVQLTSPLDRFKGFNKELDKVLIGLDSMGELYVDLGFVPEDIQSMNSADQNEFHKELMQHGTLVMGLIQHPLIQILTLARSNSNAEKQELLEVPTGVWQHYKGTYYEMIGPITSTDHHCQGVMYKEKDNPESKIYTITLYNFFTKKEVNGELVNRYTKIS